MRPAAPGVGGNGHGRCREPVLAPSRKRVAAVRSARGAAGQRPAARTPRATSPHARDRLRLPRRRRRDRSRARSSTCSVAGSRASAGGRSRSGIPTWRSSSGCSSRRPRPSASTSSGSSCWTPTARGHRRDRQPRGPRAPRRPRRDPDLQHRPLEPDLPVARRLLVPDPRQRLGAQAARARPRAPRGQRRPDRVDERLVTAGHAEPAAPTRVAARHATRSRRSTRRRSCRAGGRPDARRGPRPRRRPLGHLPRAAARQPA